MRGQKGPAGEPEELPPWELSEKLGCACARVVWEYLILPQRRARRRDFLKSLSSAVPKVYVFQRDNFFVCLSVWSDLIPRMLVRIFAKAITLPIIVAKIKNHIPETDPFPNNTAEKSKQRRYHTLRLLL